MTERIIKFYLIVGWRDKSVRVLKRKPKASEGGVYGHGGYHIGEIPIEMNLTLEVPDDPVLRVDATVTVTESAIVGVFMKDITDG